MFDQKQNKPCACYDSGVCLSSRHASWGVATLILLCFGFFMGGFFMGKRKAIHDLHITVDQDSLADKIYTSLCTMQESKVSIVQQEKESLDIPENQRIACEQLQPAAIEAVDLDTIHDDQALIVSAQIDSESDIIKNTTVVPVKKYYAQLIGFGTLQAAESFVQRLQKKKISVVARPRHSKTAKGKKITWYQVVTQEVSDRGSLEQLVDEIKIKERLKDVRIVAC